MDCCCFGSFVGLFCGVFDDFFNGCFEVDFFVEIGGLSGVYDFCCGFGVFI